MDVEDRIITLNLIKRKLGGLGFLVKERAVCPPAVISHVVKGGVAEESGILQAGDVLLSVNGISLSETTFEHALDILTGLPIGKPALLTVRISRDNNVTSESNVICNGSDHVTATCGGSGRIIEGEKDGKKSNDTNNVVLNGPSKHEENQKIKSVLENGSKDEQLIKAPGSDSSDGAKSLVEKLLSIGESNQEASTPISPKFNFDEVKSKAESELKKNQANSQASQVTTLASLVKQKTKYVRLQNLLSGTQLVDTLHQSSQTTHCTATRCMGSLMQPYGGEAPEKRPYGMPRPKEEVKVHAIDFINQYYTSIKRNNTAAHEKRLQQVLDEINETGTYELEEKELIFGAKLAWRNAPRCIGRIQWNKLQVFDARDVTSAHGMFEACCKHIKYGTNKGKLRSAITIFPQRREPMKDFRVWNSQYIRYAGYRQPDGSVIGDPSNVEFTEICQALGWKPRGGRFDILPLVLQANGQDPEMFEIPEDLLMEVKLRHPKYPWFEELGLQWYALPAVSGMLFDVGGVEFPCCPFNGWYMATEIGTRNFGDSNRYNMLEVVAQKMGLDVKSPTSLWKDKAVVEITLAVLHSYNEAGVTIVDHHTAADTFMKHLENEQRLRGGCPADWVWIIPPISGSVTPVFHQEMLNYSLKPSYEYQEDPWKYHPIVKKPLLGKKRFGFKEVAKAVKFSAKLMGQAMAKRNKATILYATETGKSERYAKMLGELFSHAFDPKVMCMEDYNFPELEHEQLVLIVTSTFGNGEAPGNGEAFGEMLYTMRNPPEGKGVHKRLSSIHIQKSVETNKKKDETQPLANLRYSVFGLGSRAYPHFCAFAHSVNKLVKELGGEEIFVIGEGDELCGQEESFRNWAKSVFKAACETFCVGEEVSVREATESMNSSSTSWCPGRFKFVTEKASARKNVIEGLSKVHNKKVYGCKFISKKDLQAEESSRSTILVRIDTEGRQDLSYVPGDHLAIFPANQGALVAALIAKLNDAPDPDDPIRIEVCKEVSGPFGVTKRWEAFERLPVPCSLKEAFSTYLDVTSPPTPQMLMHLATQATKQGDREKLEQLGKGTSKYEDWKYDRYPNIVEIIEEFPSLKIDALLLLTQLPLLQSRYYSISSSPLMYPGEVHATVAVVTYKTRGGQGPIHHGVCSTWLNSLTAGEIVPCSIRSAPSFHLPDDPTLPIILVGPGTGIAPFRSFWQHRYYQMHYMNPPVPKEEEEADVVSGFIQNRQGLEPSPLVSRKKLSIQSDTGSEACSSLSPHDSPGGSTEDLSNAKLSVQSSSPSGRNSVGNSGSRKSSDQSDSTSGEPLDNSTWGEIDLYFGCRNSKLDDIYKDETAESLQSGALTNVYTALSREENHPKMYVQDLLKKHKDSVCEKLLLDRGHMYVCGDVSMASDVSKTLQNMLQEFAALSQQEAQECIDKLRASGRFHEDIFGVTLRTAEVTDRVRSAARKAWIYISGSTKKLRAVHPRKEIVMPLRSNSATDKASKKPRPPSRTSTVTVLMQPDDDDSLSRSNDFPSLEEEAETGVKQILSRQGSLPPKSFSTISNGHYDTDD